jgi:hypothetical protein
VKRRTAVDSPFNRWWFCFWFLAWLAVPALPFLHDEDIRRDWRARCARIHEGMTRAQADAVLGPPKTTMQIGLSEVCGYHGLPDEAILNVWFRNGKVEDKQKVFKRHPNPLLEEVKRFVRKFIP